MSLYYIINSSWPIHAYMKKWIRPWLVQIMACRLFSDMLYIHYINQCLIIVNWNWDTNVQWNLHTNTIIFMEKVNLKTSSAKWHFFGVMILHANIITEIEISSIITCKHDKLNCANKLRMFLSRALGWLSWLCFQSLVNWPWQLNQLFDTIFSIHVKRFAQSSWLIVIC